MQRTDSQEDPVILAVAYSRRPLLCPPCPHEPGFPAPSRRPFLRDPPTRGSVLARLTFTSPAPCVLGLSQWADKMNTVSITKISIPSWVFSI